MYRAYASDIVYELVCSNGLTASNRIGARVRSFWGPIANKATGIADNKDGIYILKQLPLRPLVPAPFQDGYLNQVKKSAAKIKAMFAKHEATRHAKDWEEFVTNPKLYPNTKEVTDYIHNHPEQYTIPVFFDFLRCYEEHKKRLEQHGMIGTTNKPSSAVVGPKPLVLEQVAMHCPRWGPIASTQPYMFPRATVSASLMTNDFTTNPELLEQVRLQQLTEMAADCENLPTRTHDQLVVLCKHLDLNSTGSSAEMVLR